MSTPPPDRPAERHLSLRERKKLKTRRSIQEHALRLFQEQGFEATTVEQIAEAAEVSPSTFFRYFPTKEDTVLTDEYDPMIVRSLREQPPEVPPIEVLRTTMRQIVGMMLERDRNRMIERTRFLLSIPSLRARQWDQVQDSQEMINTVLAERLGRSGTDFEIRAFSAAVLGVWTATILAWVEAGAEDDLLTLLDHGLDFLAAGCPL